jgi:hypothetical protein
MRNKIFFTSLLLAPYLLIKAQAILTISTSGQTGTSGSNWSISGGVLNVIGNASVNPSVITNYLNTSGNLTVQVSTGNSSGNNISVESNITYTGNLLRTLTFKAKNDIVVNAGVTISSTNAAMNLVLWSATGNISGDVFFGATSSYTSPATIQTNGGHLWIGGGSGSETWNGITVGDGHAIGGTGRTVGGSFTHYNGVTIQATAIATAGGDIMIKCKGRPNSTSLSTEYSGGIYLVGTGTMNSGGGDISIYSLAGAGGGQKYGLYNLGAYTFSTGSGNLLLSGDASESSSTSGSSVTGRGLFLWTNVAPINSSGNINLIGKKSTASGTYGIDIRTNISTTNGNIVMDGNTNIYLGALISATGIISITGDVELYRTISLGSANLIINGITTGTPTYWYKTNGSGSVKRSIPNASSFTFPIGNSTYNPVTIKNNTGTADEFSVRVADEVYVNGVSGNISNQPRINRTWHIGKINSNSGAGVDFTFQWNAINEEIGTFTSSSRRLNHHNGSNWTFANGTSGSPGGTTSAKTMTHTGYTGSFSPFAIGDAATTLPVTWQSFTAQKNNEKVVLTWSTASEQNTKDFEILHSTDASNWYSLGNVIAAGNSTNIQYYRFDHVNPFKNNIQNYYRVKQRDLDGQHSLSKIISIRFDQIVQEAIVYPNPAADKLIIYIAKDQEVRLINLSGVTILKIKLTAGRHELNIGNFPKGAYILQIENNFQKIIFQ